MKRLLITLALVAAPGAVRAQQVPLPVPLPGRDTVPTVALLLPGESRADAVLSGAVQGAMVGAASGAALAQQHPECALASSPGESAVQGAALGGVWGGLHALFGRRAHAQIPTSTSGDRLPRALPRPGLEDGAPLQPLAGARCLASAPRTDRIGH